MKNSPEQAVAAAGSVHVGDAVALLLFIMLSRIVPSPTGPSISVIS